MEEDYASTIVLKERWVKNYTQVPIPFSINEQIVMNRLIDISTDNKKRSTESYPFSKSSTLCFIKANSLEHCERPLTSHEGMEPVLHL
jgi:hypothetical protein